MTRVLAVAAVLALGIPPRQEQEPRFQEAVEVERVLLDVRVVDGRGLPIVGLGTADFSLKVEGRSVPVESVQWVSAENPYFEGPDGIALGKPVAAGQPEAPPGRLIVFLFQKDLDPSRVTGLMQMCKEAVKLLDTLGRGDRVAVLSFDSRLKLWADFTDDREQLRHAIERSILFREHPPRTEGPFPSMAANFDQEAARRAGTIEEGLAVTARALEPLPGSKSLVLFGWGFGRLGLSGVAMEADYEPAALALKRARVSVFCLDVTNADYHSLEAGLRVVATDTGGFYARTHLFSTAAMNRLKGALAGHYILAFEKPALRRGHHEVRVRLVGRKGTVMAKPSYVDSVGP